LSQPIRTIDELDTPVVTVDLDAVERNVARMQAYCDVHGIRLRPHVKTHKLPQVARLQLQAGATGICCQKLGEAEVMAEAGARDIFLTYPILGEQKLARLARLARDSRILVAVDSSDGLAALQTLDAELEVLVDCDTGFGRTGVQTPLAAADLAFAVSAAANLSFAGFTTYPAPPGTGAWLKDARSRTEEHGLAVETISVGGTPSAFSAHEVDGVTELRVGTYVYGDRACMANGTIPEPDCALRVLTTVVSRPTDERAILDAGSKTLTSDTAAGTEPGTYGHVVEHPEARIHGLSEEHGHVDVGACPRPPRIGDRVTVIPNHACTVTNLHDTVVVHRGGRVEDVWAVAARGRSQ
jgi:D-serine deaminase-like pyridoxal phosphate-dependent protein